MKHPHVEEVNGTALVKGTRIPVRRLWVYHRRGLMTHMLIKRYPQLGWAKVLDALSYAYDNQTRMAEELAREAEILQKGDTMEQLKFEFYR